MASPGTQLCSEKHSLVNVHLSKQGCRSIPVCHLFLLAMKRVSGKGNVIECKRETT